MYSISLSNWETLTLNEPVPPLFLQEGHANLSANGGLPKGETTIAQPFKVGYERATTHPVPEGDG
jgi:hypothetical protein